MKTLVIAEKPSVARDLADALPGTFENHDTYLESEDTLITFAVGHLVELIDPEDYDERFKKWRMADLPIVPDEFRLRPRDKKAEKQLKVIHKLLTIAGPEAIKCSKDLAQKEGIFVGITAGGTLAGALQICKDAPKGSTILAMLPDTGERYLSTPLFADIPADMTEEELAISRSTPSAQLPPKAA